MKSSVSKVLAAICGSSFVNFTSAVKVHQWDDDLFQEKSDDSWQPTTSHNAQFGDVETFEVNFFRLAYGFDQSVGDATLQTDFRKFVTSMQDRLNNSGEKDEHWKIKHPELHQMTLQLSHSKLHTKENSGQIDENKQRDAVHWYLLNHRKILDQADLGNHAFLEGKEVRNRNEHRLGYSSYSYAFRSHVRTAITTALDHWLDTHKFKNRVDKYADKTFHEEKIGFAIILEKFVLFGRDHVWHLGLKKDSPSWLSTFAHSKMPIDGFNLDKVLKENIKSIIKAAAAASHRWRWSMPELVKQEFRRL